MDTCKISVELRGGVIRVLAVTVLAVLGAGAGTGCARSAASPPAVPPPGSAAPAPAPTRASAGAGGEPSASSGRAPSLGAPAQRQPASLDPTEEITPEELSTIPEPVPAPPAGGAGANPRSPLPIAHAGSEPDSTARERRPAGSGPLWRVQIFATQDRELADRMAKEAAEHLHVVAHVAYEASQYKVRLGDYGSEEEALPLREKALRSGFPGAFRIRCTRSATVVTD